MKIVDLSRELYHRTPSYPGQPPVIHGVWKTHEEAFAESGNVQGNSVSGATSVTLSASYSGPLAPLGTSMSSTLTVAPTDTLHVTKATWSKSTQTLTVTATSTNAAAIVNVLNSNGNVPLGTMTNLGAGSYSLQMNTPSIASVNLKSNLGGSTGQGVTVVP